MKGLQTIETITDYFMSTENNPIYHQTEKLFFHAFYQRYHRKIFENDGSSVLNCFVSSAFHKSQVKWHFH